MNVSSGMLHIRVGRADDRGRRTTLTVTPSPLTEERIESVLPWIKQEAFKFNARYHADVDDLVQEGRIGAWVASERYTEGRGVSYLSYARYWINARMNIFSHATFRNVRVSEEKFHSVPIAEISMSHELGEGFTIMDTLEASEPEERDLELLAQLEGLLSTLNSKQQIIMRGIYLLGKKEYEMAAQFGHSRQAVHQIKNKCLRKLRQMMTKKANLL